MITFEGFFDQQWFLLMKSNAISNEKLIPLRAQDSLGGISI
jgi:hypothetical protein